MAQIFHPSTNSLTKLTIVLVALGIPILGMALYAVNMSYGYNYYVPIEQPVQFSHKHHVGDDGIDCRYCHTSVEKTAYAGMPPTHTCMSCHSQIWSDSPELQSVRASYLSGQPIEWNRVHDMPDFVYFNHSIHVKKGVGCETCHGRVDEKPLMFKSHTMTMSWCLDCHRQPEKYIRPREAVFTMGWEPGKPRGVAAPSMATAPKKYEGKPRADGAHSEEATPENAGGAHSGEERPGSQNNGPANNQASGEHSSAVPSTSTAPKNAGSMGAAVGESLSGGPLSGVAQAAEVKGSGAAESGAKEENLSQIELGLQLKQEYKIKSARELTDCATCHR